MVRMVTNRWHPDVCDCIVDFEFDADLDGDTRTHTGKAIQKGCPEHSGLGNPHSFYTAILDECRRKERVKFELLENFVAVRDTDADGNFVFKNGISVNYSFTGQDDTRVLHLSLVGHTLTAQQKAIIQSLADSRFGAGKVVIE